MKLGLQKSAEGPFPGMVPWFLRRPRAGIRPEHELPGAAGKRGVSTGMFPAKPLSPRLVPSCRRDAGPTTATDKGWRGKG